MKLAVITIASVIIALSTYLQFVAVKLTVVDSQIIRGDAADYVSYAMNLKESETFSRLRTLAPSDTPPPPDALRSPGYPFFISLFFAEDFRSKPPEETLSPIVHTQAILGVLTVIIWMYIIFKATNWWLSLVGGFLIAINPHLINISTNLLTESLFVFELSILCLSFYFYLKSKSKWTLTIVVIVLAAASLTRPSTQYFIAPLLALVYFIEPPPNRFKTCIAMGAIFVALIGMWNVRNLYSIGKPSDPTLQANFLQHGMYPNFMYDGKEETKGYPYRFDPQNNVIYGNTGLVIETIITRFRNAPAEHLKWYLLGKPYYLFSWNMIEGYDEIFIYPVVQSPYYAHKTFIATRVFSKSTHWILNLLAAAAVLYAVVTIARNLNPTPPQVLIFFVSLFLLYFTALHIIGAPFPRYGIPLRPMIIMMACIAIFQGMQQYKQVKSSTT